MTVRPGARAAVVAISRAKARGEARLVDRRVADVAVEVAIRALRQAERPVHVDAEGRFARRCIGARQISASLTKARARCDRPSPSGGRPCFSIAGHLAEGARRGRRAGTSDRSRSRRCRAAARPACRRRAPRPLRDGRRARRRTAPRRSAPCACPAWSRRAPAAVARSALIAAEILGLAGPARRIDAGRAAERIDHEAGIVGEGRQAAPRSAAAIALIAALARKSSPVSSGSGRPSSPAETASTPCGASSSRISPSLPGLWVAITSRPVIRAVHVRSDSGDRELLQFDQPRDALRARVPSARGTRPRENGVLSAVPWISTMPPSPVMTKLASVSASESSA